MNNLQYASQEVRAEVQRILASDGVHFFTKEIIQKGLTKDALDAVYDVKLALEYLEKVFKSAN